MDPSHFIKLTVRNLFLTLLPIQPNPSSNINTIHPTVTTSPCHVTISLSGFPSQTSLISHSPNTSISATFHLTKKDINRLTKKRSKLGLVFNSSQVKGLTMVVYSGGGGVNKGRVLGKVVIELGEIKGVDNKSNGGVVICDGWRDLNGSKIWVCVRADPDPRFVFEFGGEPECSPLVFQSQGFGNISQPVFSCRFSLRTSVVADRSQRIRSLQSEQGSGRGWLSSFGSDRERPGKERKGWSITVHDLSGSPVAAASMVTPFVASPGSDRVSRSNPGSWLILRPGDGTWNPWGRLEAWRERGSSDGVGYKFELIPDMSANSGIVLAETTLSTSKGGKFLIDLASPNLNTNFTNNNNNSSSSSSSCGGSLKSGQRSSSATGCSPRGGSGDFGYGLWPFSTNRGFVMSASVEGEGKCSKPTVEVSVQHVSCTEDAAAFVALAAAIDLSIDACKLFSQKLRKELCQKNDLGC